MVDTCSKKKRSAIMSRIGQKNTTPELLVRKLLFGAGYRYRLHDKSLPGSPDMVLKKYQTAIFVNGCFWHHHEQCRDGHTPKSNKKYWRIKFSRNVARDMENQELLGDLGWLVLIVWECEIKTSPGETLERLIKSLQDNV